MGLLSSIGSIFTNPTAALNIGSTFMEPLMGMETNRINRHMAQDQMQFQQYNSNTAHQREMADLYAAGLNPILSAKYGGASTPSGTSTSIENPMKGFSRNIQDAVSLSSQIRQNAANTDLANANAYNKHLENERDKAFNDFLNDPSRKAAREMYFEQRATGSPLVGLGSTFSHGLMDVGEKTWKDLKEAVTRGLEQSSSNAKQQRDKLNDFLLQKSDLLKKKLTDTHNKLKSFD